jgi:hypothetical protein
MATTTSVWDIVNKWPSGWRTNMLVVAMAMVVCAKGGVLEDMEQRYNPFEMAIQKWICDMVPS